MNNDYVISKNILSKELCQFIALEFSMMETACKHLYPRAKLSDLCENTFARYSPLMIEALSLWVQPEVEKITGKRLWPTYSYARIYYKGSELQKHFDRPSSEYTVSLCLEKDDDWPIYIKNEQGTEHEINLEVGDMVVYSGRRHEHWRNPLTSERQIQAFLQYVDADGDSAWLKWDTRPCLGLPFEWTSDAIKQELQKISSVRDLLKR
jgi:hypothetical protein